MSGKRALLVGNGTHRDPKFAHLAKANADINALANVLRDQTIGGFDFVECLPDPAVDHLRRKISAFFYDARSDDLLLFFFAGHGLKDERGELYLAVVDTEYRHLAASALSANFLRQSMDRSHSCRQLLILDCCYSGAFFDGVTRGDADEVDVLDSFDRNASGRVTITSTDRFQLARETTDRIAVTPNSVFSHYLVEGLRSGEADLNHDGLVTVDEWYDFVSKRVADATRNAQTPRINVADGCGTIAVARNPNPEPAEVPEEISAALRSALPRTRERVIPDLLRLAKGKPSSLRTAAAAALRSLADDDDELVQIKAVKALRAAHLDVPRRPRPKLFGARIVGTFSRLILATAFIFMIIGGLVVLRKGSQGYFEILAGIALSTPAIRLLWQECEGGPRPLSRLFRAVRLSLSIAAALVLFATVVWQLWNA